MNSLCHWAEIRADYVDESNIVHIDAWRTGQDDEEGNVIAYVFLDYRKRVQVIYSDPQARVDQKAQEAIEEGKRLLLEVV